MRILIAVAVLVGSTGCEGGTTAEAPSGPVVSSGEVCACEAPAEALEARLYARQADAPALPGELGTATAWCDPGDVAISGGCVWGKAPGTVDPVSSGPVLDGAGAPIGWECSGLARVDAGNHAPTYSTAVCAVAP